MINLALAIAAGIVTALIVHLLHFGWLASILPAALAVLAAYVVLARRTSVQLQALATQAQDALSVQPRSEKERDAMLDRAIRIFESGFPLTRWQFLIAPTLHAQIGMLKYVKKDFAAAQPHLEKAMAREWMAKVMLGCIHYLAKADAPMKAAFEEAVGGGGKKEPLCWATYAWCVENLKQHDAAVAVAGRAVAENPSDEKLKKLQNQLQNDKRLKMNLFEPQWWQFGLEKPPMELTQPRVRFQGRRR